MGKWSEGSQSPECGWRGMSMALAQAPAAGVGEVGGFSCLTQFEGGADRICCCEVGEKGDHGCPTISRLNYTV